MIILKKSGIVITISNEDKTDKLIELYDKENDRYMLQRICIPYGSILILEGVFLQRKELKNYFDFTIYLDVSKKIRLSRVLVRDDI